MKRAFLWLLAFAGGADCVFVPLLFALSLPQPLFPQPGFYFLEISLLGLVGLISVARSRWQFVPWLVAGVMLVFNILGAWTIGLYLIPATICFLGAGFLMAGQQSLTMLQGLGFFLAGVFAQGALMSAWIYLA